MISMLARRTGLVLCSLMLVLFMSACTEGDSTVSVDSKGDAQFTLTPPSFLQTRALVRENLDLRVTITTINGDQLVVMKTGGNNTWTGSANVPQNSAVRLTVEWSAIQPDGREVLLATAFDDTQNDVNAPFTFYVRESIYSTAYDDDGDDIINLAELKQGLNPLVPDNSDNGVAPDVKIFWSSLPPTEIDGRVGSDRGDPFWDDTVHTDVERKLLTVGNIIRDDIGDTEEILLDEDKYQWTASHDGQYLTLFVYGKKRNGSTIAINGDSGIDFHKDDSLEIFLDGDLSRLQDYDSVDDILINIPLARGVSPDLEENNSNDANKRIDLGSSVKPQVKANFNVQNPQIVEFDTCFCGGDERATWEVRINLAAANIEVGRTFGFELQINRDDNGGERDSKWAWAKPARGPNQSDDDADTTWLNPSQMGKALLLRPPVE